jgi:hypothetical protein
MAFVQSSHNELEAKMNSIAINRKYKGALFFTALLFSALFFMSNVFSQSAASPIGQWRSIDDETGKPKSIIELYETNRGEMEGKIVKLLNPSKPNPVCDKCEGARANQPITGMVIVWGVKPNEEGDQMEWW